MHWRYSEILAMVDAFFFTIFPLHRHFPYAKRNMLLGLRFGLCGRYKALRRPEL